MVSLVGDRHRLHALHDGLTRRFGDGPAVAFLENGLHQITRPGTHLLIDPADVFTEQAEREDDHAEQEERDGEQREHTLHFRADDETANQQQDEQRRGP